MTTHDDEPEEPRLGHSNDGDVGTRNRRFIRGRAMHRATDHKRESTLGFLQVGRCIVYPVDGLRHWLAMGLPTPHLHINKADSP